MLAGVLPSGTDRYVALFFGDPISSGVEVALPGYARVAHQAWSTSAIVGSSTRANALMAAFPTITGVGVIDYWAIFDASVGGNLLRAGPILDINGVLAPVVLSGGGDDLRFPVGALRVKIGDV
jgi:hypothetical protein